VTLHQTDAVAEAMQFWIASRHASNGASGVLIWAGLLSRGTPTDLQPRRRSDLRRIKAASG